MLPSDPATIHAMFERLTPGYDRFNRLSSLGMDARWRRLACAALEPGMRVLDVGTGTGDLALEAARRVGPQGMVTGLDVAGAMLDAARQKAGKAGLTGRIRWIRARAEDIPFEAEPYDAVLSGFVLRNIRHHLTDILKGIHRSLKPGGVISFVDLTEPSAPFIRRAAGWYMRTSVQLWGRILFKEAEPVAYLRESVRTFHGPREMIGALEACGFKDTRAHGLLFGMVTHYTGRK